MNADAKFNPLDLRYIDIVFGHAALNFDRAAYGIYDAAELDESAVPGILDDASAVIRDFGIEKRLSKSFQSRQRAFFVYPYQAARARDIRRQNCCQSSLYVLAAQDGPPCSGTLSVYIAQLSADVRLCAGRKWVKLRNTRNEQIFSALPPIADILGGRLARLSSGGRGLPQMPLGERAARACADKVFAISLPVGNWIVFYSFVIDHEIPFAYERPLCARSSHSTTIQFCELIVAKRRPLNSDWLPPLSCSGAASRHVARHHLARQRSSGTRPPPAPCRRASDNRCSLARRRRRTSSGRSGSEVNCAGSVQADQGWR